MQKRRVVITGIGIISPLGIGKVKFWNSLLAGDVAIDRITRFDAEGYTSQLGAEVQNFDPSDYVRRAWRCCY